MKKRLLCVLFSLLVIASSFSLAPVQVQAATTSSSYIINRYDNGSNYSGTYEIWRDFGSFKGSKKFKIECINYLSQLSKSECAYFSKYARFNVYVFKSNGQLYKFYGNLKNNSTFSIPSGTYKISIYSMIHSSGWKTFSNNTWKYPYAQYRLRY